MKNIALYIKNKMVFLGAVTIAAIVGALPQR